jgi:hypothetical protein
MSSDVHVFLKLEMSQLRDGAQESLIKLLDYLGAFVKPGQFCAKEHWILIEKRIIEASHLNARGEEADMTDIVNMLSASA